MEYYVLGDTVQCLEKVLIPIFRVQVDSKKKPAGAIGREDDDSDLVNLIEKEKKDNCFFCRKVCGVIAAREDWENFICSDQCPHKKNGKTEQPCIIFTTSGWDELANYHLDPDT